MANAEAAGSIDQALHAAAGLGLERLDAQLLMLQALGRASTERAWLLAHGSDALQPQALAAFEALAARRIGGEPVAYIAGMKEFFGLALQVDSRVLVPRPDTETLVEWALEMLASRTAPKLADLGTGSGAIALALKAARPGARVFATDVSVDALEVARGNARRLGLDVTLLRGAWLDALAGQGHDFDLIASNPPYIAAADPHLAALAHEPPGALASGADGLDDIRQIVQSTPERLAPRGWLLLEHGYDQADAVCALLAARGFTQVQSRSDLAGIRRCSGGQWPTVK